MHSERHIPLRPAFLGVGLLLFALLLLGCYGDDLSVWDLACEKDDDCVIKEVPICSSSCDGAGAAHQMSLPQCVPKDFEPASRVSCKLSAGSSCPKYKIPNACICKFGTLGHDEDDVPDRICQGIQDAGVAD